MDLYKPFWLDPAQSDHRPLTEDRAFDVVVVGGGVSGIAAAWWLTEGGFSRVAVVEGRTVASGASGRNAGFIMAVAPENFSAANDPATVDSARRIWSFTVENQRMIADVVSELGLTTEFRQRGSLGLAASDEEWLWIRQSSVVAQGCGIQVEVIQREDLPSTWVRENYFGGAWYPGNGEIHPGLLVRGLAHAVRARGVEIFEGSPVTEMRRQTSDYCLRVAGKQITAGAVLLATNAYTSRLSPAVGACIAPTRGQVLATKPITERIVDCPVYANEGYQYWRQTQGGSLVVGGWRDLDRETEVGTDETLNPTIQETLTVVANGLAGGKVPVSHRWSGIMGFTPDRLPLVGLLDREPDLAISAGFSGHGMAMAFHCSKVAVDYLLGTASEYGYLFAPRRFEDFLSNSPSLPNGVTSRIT